MAVLRRIGPGVSPLEDVDPPVRSKTTKLRLSAWRFRVVWASTVVVSVFNGLLATVFAAAYYTGLTIHGGHLIESAGLLPLRFIPCVVAAYALVALYFWSVAFEAVAASVRARHLLLQRPPSRHDRSAPWVLRVWRRAWFLWASMFAPGGIFELTPESFEFVFLLRELVEVSTQSYQAYKCSTLIAQRWINTFYVGMLATNCWVSPLIHALARRDAALQRLLYLGGDIALDFASTLVVPVCILYSVVLAAFDDDLSRASGAQYAFDVPYGDVYLMYLVKSVQQVCIVTWLDFVTKMMPFYSMASCIGHIKNLVEPPTAATAKASHVHALLAIGGTKSFRQRIRSGFEASRSQLAAKASPRSRARLQRCCQHRVVKWLLSVQFMHALFAVWGVFVVGCHLAADRVSRTAPPLATVGCKSHSQPWLVGDFSCTILEINCYRRGIAGLEHEIDAALAAVNPLGLASLIITHCPRLHVPPRVRALRNLLGLEINNATLVAWPAEAAVDQTTTPSLKYLCLVRTNLTALPDGLQAADFPRQLRDISLVASNLTTLPPNLHRWWRLLLNLYIERTPQLTHVPATVAAMGIPDDLLKGNAFQVLSLARNPITKWPATIGRLSGLLMVIMDESVVSELPQWLVDEGQRRANADADAVMVSAGGSTLCETRGTFELPGLDVSCRVKLDAEIEAFPIEFNAALRQP